MDEVHNTKTERSFEALKRLNLALVLEHTATPVPKRTNVRFHVSAQQLQAVFAMLYKLERGMDLRQQLDAALAA